VSLDELGDGTVERVDVQWPAQALAGREIEDRRSRFELLDEPNA
jgi:hypothetical protein